MNIGIIGYGFVGKSVHNSLRSDELVNIYDPKLGYHDLESIYNSDIIFIAVPTPTKNGEQDTKILFETLNKLEGYEGLVILKSTVLPNIIKYILETYKLDFIYSPEFLDQATYLSPQGRHVIGVTNIDQANTYKSLFTRYDVEVINIFITDPVTASMIKYVHNCFGALKVSFFNEIFDVCKKQNVDYREMIGILLSVNSNVGQQYTKIAVDGERGFGGCCFGKDAIAFNTQNKITTLNAAIKKNYEYRPDYMDSFLK